MTRPFNNPIYLSRRIEEMIKTSEYLGKGNNGVVYLLPDNKIIKIFNCTKVCKMEYETLVKSRKSKYFPKAYEHGSHYIIRDYVGGVRLDKYLRKNPINREIAEHIVNLYKDFKKLGYKRLDIRCKDLYVQEDFSLKVIDPKNQYKKRVSYPRHLMKGMDSRNRLEEFLSFLKDIDKKLYDDWSSKIYIYLEQKEKEHQDRLIRKAMRELNNKNK
ncbi:protein kinase [Clostridium senegalense]|uniref:Protein kinase n=1 Tax=Clostridium senegalense TaxID=1465809 RepID=A0A6M0H7M3_9CLOT|nr:protein kinase [Clostridium senegalense]NEU06557.1 protein kinase [Clostridium senegalense]